MFQRNLTTIKNSYATYLKNLPKIQLNTVYQSFTLFNMCHSHKIQYNLHNGPQASLQNI